MSRTLCSFSAVLACLTIPSFSAMRADSTSRDVGRKVPNFQLRDARGHTVSLGDFRDKKAVVVIFIGTECPISNGFLPRLQELHREFAPRGVQFLAVNSNALDSADDVAEHARKFAIPFPVLKDEDNRVADDFAARRTPQAFVLDRSNIIRYSGRIDDRFGMGYQRPRPTRNDLADAIAQLLDGKPITQPSTLVAGCLIGRKSRPRSDGSITYARDVSRIFQKNCQECHRPGQAGPMSLLTFDDAVGWSAMIREVVEERRMPPWDADPHYGTFANDRSLSDADRATILAWLEQGTPRGDDQDLPPAREFSQGWTIGKPDAVFTMPKAFHVPAKMPPEGVPYQRFYVETGFSEDRWIERAEAKPGAPEVVHHIVVYVVPAGQDFVPDDPRFQVLAGTAPGDMPVILRPGYAKKVPAGARLVFEMHYTPSGKGQPDRSSLGLVFAKKPPQSEVLTAPIANPMFRIPPGAKNYEVEATFRFKRPGVILALMPHMHLRGKNFRYEAVYPDGKVQTLLYVPRYNFNWQSVYRLLKPLPVPAGTRVRCIAHFDNSPANPNNPDPAKAVEWGDQTWEEMMIGWMDYALERDARAGR
jgi:peroxiredoxin/mono/diheme cytochrome c family protein